MTEDSVACRIFIDFSLIILNNQQLINCLPIDYPRSLIGFIVVIEYLTSAILSEISAQFPARFFPPRFSYLGGNPGGIPAAKNSPKISAPGIQVNSRDSRLISGRRDLDEILAKMSKSRRLNTSRDLSGSDIINSGRH